jgi:hypothetical protein
METYGRVNVQIHVFLTSALVGDEWIASHPDRFTPWEKAPGTHWIGGRRTPEPVWTLWRKEKSCSTGTRIPTPHLSSPYLVAIPTASARLVKI